MLWFQLGFALRHCTPYMLGASVEVVLICAHVLMVDSKSVWSLDGPQGSPAPRWEAEVRVFNVLAEGIMVALGKGEGGGGRLVGGCVKWPAWSSMSNNSETAGFTSVRTEMSRSDSGRIIADIGGVVKRNWMIITWEVREMLMGMSFNKHVSEVRFI